MYRLGVDIGGTFTDLVIQDADSGFIQTLKVPSTPHDPSEAVLDAIRRAADSQGWGSTSQRLASSFTARRSRPTLSCKASEPGSAYW